MDRLIQVLSDLGEPDPQIAETFLIKFGCLAFVPVDLSKERYPVTELLKTTGSEEEAVELVAGVDSKVFTESLTNHPNVFDLTVLEDDAPSYQLPGLSGTFVGGNAFYLRVKLPARLQKYSWLTARREDPVEEFEVVSSGSLFATYFKIEHYPIQTSVGQEYRQLVKQQINQTASSMVRVVSPTPIHPNFFLIFRQQESEEELGLKVYSFDDDVLVVADRLDLSEQQMMLSFFKKLERPLLDFYSNRRTDDFLLYHSIEISNRFSDLQDSLNQLHTTPAFRMVKSAQHSRKGRTTLSKLHVLLVQLETRLFKMENAHVRFFDRLKSDPILSVIQKYFFERLTPEVTIPKAITSALNHFDADLRTFVNIRWVVVASIVGAAVGALLTVIFTQILAK